MTAPSAISPPSYNQKPSRAAVSKLIEGVQTELLTDGVYSPDAAAEWTKSLSDKVRDQLRDLGLPRYKYIVRRRSDRTVESDPSHSKHLPLSLFVANSLQRQQVQVTLGEQRTEGVHVGCRCLWDGDTDNYASNTFKNDSIFCVVSAYWVYQY